MTKTAITPAFMGRTVCPHSRRVLAYTCTKSEPWGYICGGVGLVAGMLKYRALVQYNSETVKRFKNTYKDEMDVKKFNKFVETHF